VTLSISPTRSGLTTTIVCKGCEHGVREDEPDVWVDSNGDAYFQGRSGLSLIWFVQKHIQEVLVTQRAGP
jgi:hypothetical protein